MPRLYKDSTQKPTMPRLYSTQKPTMPRLYLKEAEPFLLQDKKVAMEKHMMRKRHKDVPSYISDPTKERRMSKRTASLVFGDAVIVILEMLQILALIQSMGLKWSWPKTWVKYTNFLFILNADVWEFMKVDSGGYTRIQGKETASSEVPVDYDHILMAWAGFLVVMGLCFLISYLVLNGAQPPYLMVHYAKMEQVFFFIIQIITLPLGTTIFRLFHCTGSDTMAVHNSYSCHKDVYWAYVAPAILLVISLFGAVPLWMVYRIRKQKLASADNHHDAFLRLKEVEYEAGLDVVWVVQGFYLFSSFRLCAVYFRPIMQIVKLLLLVIFSALFLEIHAQAVTLAVFLSILSILVVIFRPFRVTSFNVALSLSLGCLAGNAIFGSVMTSVTPATVETPWLVKPYSYYILTGINVILVGTLIVWVVWLMCRAFCSSCNRKCFPNSPLWPTLLSYELKVDGEETYKFMAAVLRARAVLDACLRAPSVFAPVHQLSRHIQIINVCVREAEKTRDGMHPTLLHLLDDMTDIHRRLEPGSLFAEKVHENIRQNAANFVAIMPAFCHRLAQRDFDLMLVDPVKKRLLMKMSIIAMFVNKNNTRLVKDSHTQKGLQKLWNELPQSVYQHDEYEYQEDLHPLPVLGPETENQYMTGVYRPPIQLMDIDDSDEEESLATFLSRVPPILAMKSETSSRCSSLTHLGSQIEQLTLPSALTPVDRVEVKNTQQVTKDEGRQMPLTTQQETVQDSHVDSNHDDGLVVTAVENDLAEVSELGLENEGFVMDGEVEGRAESLTTGGELMEGGEEIPVENDEMKSGETSAEKVGE